MKSSAIVGLLVVMACASSGTPQADVGTPGGGDQGHRGVIFDAPGGSMAEDFSFNINPDAGGMAAWHDIAAPEATTWQAVATAYQKLGLAITRYDTAAHIIEGQRLRSRADFGGKELKSLMNCGDVEGMPNVTRFDVNIMTRTLVKGSGTGSDVASAMIATAKPGGVSGVVMPCTVNASAGDVIASAVKSVVAGK
jgi:hypothetical protein